MKKWCSLLSLLPLFLLYGSWRGKTQVLKSKKLEKESENKQNFFFPFLFPLLLKKSHDPSHLAFISQIVNHCLRLEPQQTESWKLNNKHQRLKANGAVNHREWRVVVLADCITCLAQWRETSQSSFWWSVSSPAQTCRAADRLRLRACSPSALLSEPAACVECETGMWGYLCSGRDREREGERFLRFQHRPTVHVSGCVDCRLHKVLNQECILHKLNSPMLCLCSDTSSSSYLKGHTAVLGLVHTSPLASFRCV